MICCTVITFADDQSVSEKNGIPYIEFYADRIGWDPSEIDLTEAAEGKYRMGDVWIGENVSDVQASMRNGNFEMILDTDLDGIHFRRSYRNADTGLTYIVYYGQFSYVEKITLKYTNGL